MQRHITFDRLHNFRDIGGYAAGDGRTVAWKRLYRADSLGKLAGADSDRFLDLGVKTVIDLRYAFEIEAAGRVPAYPGLDYHHLSVEHQPYHQPSLDPGLDPARLFADKHHEVAHDGVVELRQALDVVAFGSGPTVIHCTSGKDRTGLLIALILGLLGVSDEDIIADYALTELATSRFIADYYADGTKPPLRWPGYGTAPASAMRLFLEEINIKYGSITGYGVAELDVDEDLIATLRRQLLAHPGDAGQGI
jgi:protein-tyrosine phosphatase